MKLGFIGVGNMGGALAQAVSAAKCGELLLSNRTADKAETLAQQLGAVVSTNQEIAAVCDYLFLGVKPQLMEQMLSEIAPVLSQRKDTFVLVPMAAGLTMEVIRQMAGGNYPVIRIMPNTAVAVGAGITLYNYTDNVTSEQLDYFLTAMSKSGLLDHLPEHLIDAGSAVAGCGGAFADLFMEALSDGGVYCGLPRKSAQLYAAQMLLGTAKLLLVSGEHPGVLKDAVCSPGGTTIAGVRALEEGGFRAAAMNAVIAACEKTASLKK